MKEKTVNALRRIQALTESKCRACPNQPTHRCCDDFFCGIVHEGLRKIGKSFPRTANPIRFMGEKGCVVPPEYRPGCSGFVCPERLQEDRKFRREWDRLHDKFQGDPEVTQMMSAVSPNLKTFRRLR